VYDEIVARYFYKDVYSMNKINKHSSKILFVVFILFIILSISATYYKMLVLRDFVIINDVALEVDNTQEE